MNPTNHLELSENTLIVIKILEIMLQSKKKSLEEEYLKIDINILKGEKNFLTQICSKSKWNEDYYEKILKIKDQFNDKIMLKDENKFPLTNKVNTENEVLQLNDEIKFDRNEIPNVEKFFCIELKPKFSLDYLEEFEDIVLKKIHALKELHSHVKFKFTRDSKILHNDSVEFEKDVEICCFVSSALLNIVKQSQREEYRKKTFNLFSVTNYEDLDYAIKNYLLSQIHGKTDKNTMKPPS